MRHLLLAALAAAALTVAGPNSATAQTVGIVPATGQTYVQYYTPYTYGSTAYYTYPNTAYLYSTPYTSSYVAPSVVYPGYTTSYPYYYNQTYYTYPYSTYYYPGYTTYYGTRRWWW